MRNLNSLGKVLDALVKAGSNNISGVSFSIENDDELRDRARKAAVEEAMRKAKVLAAAAKVRLGKVLAISEQSISAAPQGRFESFQADSVPVASGELDVVETLFLQFQIM